MDISTGHIILFVNLLVIFQALTFLVIFLRTISKNRDLKTLIAYELLYIMGYLIIVSYVLDFHRLFFFGNLFIAPLFASLPILVYYYIVVLTRGSLVRKHYLHLFLPVSLLLINILFYVILDPGDISKVIIQKELSLHAPPALSFFYSFNHVVIEIILGVQPFVYVVLSFFSIRKQHRILERNYSNFKSISLFWAKKLLIVFTILYSISYLWNSDIYFLSFILVINGYLGVEAIRYKEIFLKLHIKDEVIPDQDESAAFSASGLGMQRKKQIQGKIMHYMSNDKPYLDPDFSLMILAEAIGENRQYVSVVINELQKKNFSSFVNAYRIKWFLDCYRKNNSYSIEGLSKQAGFNSKSSFYSAFKKVTGKRPGDYF